MIQKLIRFKRFAGAREKPGLKGINMTKKEMIQSIRDLINYTMNLRMDTLSLDDELEKAYDEIQPYDGQERFTGEQVALRNWLADVIEKLTDEMAAWEAFEKDLLKACYKAPFNEDSD